MLGAPGAPGGPGTHPPSDPGIAAATVDEMLDAERELLERFKYCYGCDAATFEHDIVRAIRAYASYFNVLPATADNFFCGAGGLFRLGLEVAFFALQGTDAHIVSGRATISVRKELEPRWRQATFLAGLCSELHRTLGHAAVTDEHGNEWPAYLAPLTTWLRQRKARRFYVRWIVNTPETRAPGLFALPHIVPPETMQHLATGNHVVVPQMLACLSGLPLLHEPSILVDLVKRSAALVIDRDLVASAHRYGRPILGAHIERYLLDAMRRLVASHPAWSPNTERSRVWFGADGLFVVWPNACAEIRKVLEDDELRGIPKSPETIGEILTAAGVLQPPPGAQGAWTIQPPGVAAPIEAVRLRAADILQAGQSRTIQPLAQALAVRAAPATSRPAASASAAAKPTEPAAGAPAATVAAQQCSLDLEGADADPHGRDDADTRAPSPHARAAAPAATATTSQAAQPAAAPATEPAPRFALRAPMRLVPQVRQALAAAIDSLNGEPRHACAFTVPAGVSVPLRLRAAGVSDCCRSSSVAE
jgi:conjugal transfer pilus assembly protein TraI